MVKTLLLPLILLLAQKPVEKPKVHTDFYFGTYPANREAEETVKHQLARTILAGYHEGWSLDKMAKTLKLAINDLNKMSDKLEDEGLLRRIDDYDMKPAMVVIRDRDYDRIKDSVKRHTQEFTKLIADNWKDIEAMADSLEGAKGMPKDRVMYETVVSGILLGGMMDAFFEDKTLMPGPPRHAKNRYFAWLIESNPALAGNLRRELRESSGYRIVTIGNVLSDEKLNPDDLRGKATILEEADARKYRTFIATFSRDKLLPYFKNHREEFLKLGALIQSGSYVALAEFFCWYYVTMANGTADALAAAKRVAPPEKLYTYAVKAPQ